MVAMFRSTEQKENISMQDHYELEALGCGAGKKNEHACNTTHFPRSHLPQYLARPTVFNFRERTGSGVFIVV